LSWSRDTKCVWAFLVIDGMIECVFILAPCNINAISTLIVMNNIMEELVMIATHYENQIIVNQSTKSIPISNIDYNHLKKYFF